jgi:hypothetical protein
MYACQIYSNPIGFYVKTMSAHGSHLGWRSWSPDTILKVYYPRTIHAIFALNRLTGFRGEDLNNFPIGSYVKTMSADGGHFGSRSGSLNTILEVDHLRTIDDMFAILAYWFQRRRFKKKIPMGSYVKTISAEFGHLGWRSGSPDTILKIDHLRTIHAMFALNWLTGFRGEDF